MVLLSAAHVFGHIVAICTSPALHICASCFRISPIPKLPNPNASSKASDRSCYLPSGKMQMRYFQQLHVSLAITYIPFQFIGCWKFSNTWRLHAQRFLLCFSERPNKPTTLIRFCSCGHRTSCELRLITWTNSCHEGVSHGASWIGPLAQALQQHSTREILQFLDFLARLVSGLFSSFWKRFHNSFFDLF